MQKLQTKFSDLACDFRPS